MAAILLPVAEWPTAHTLTLATTWTRCDLDPRTEVVTVDNEDISIAVYVAFDKMGLPASVQSPTDGGAVGSSRIRVPAGVARAFRVKAIRGDGVSAAIYVASASGTPTCTVIQELGPA